MSVRCVVAAVTLSIGLGLPVRAQVPGRSVRDGVYGSLQADRGRVVYEERCVSCHGAMSSITPDMAALLSDHTFRARWAGRSLAELFELIRETMPQDEPGTLQPEQTTDLLAYILRSNRLPVGDLDLTSDLEGLGQISFDR